MAAAGTGKHEGPFRAAGFAMAISSNLGNPSLVQGFGRVVRSPAGPSSWADDLTPIADSDWSYDFAAHLLERAGFGGTPEEVARLAAVTPAQAVPHLVDYKSVPNDIAPFDPSGVWDPGLRDFPPSRPAATRRARRQPQPPPAPRRSQRGSDPPPERAPA